MHEHVFIRLPGVFTDGQHRRYTADAPEVQAYLADARDTLELPPIDCPIVYTLAAMAVRLCLIYLHFCLLISGYRCITNL